eukprot:5666226-Prymnesium_polylepis.2
MSTCTSVRASHPSRRLQWGSATPMKGERNLIDAKSVGRQLRSPVRVLLAPRPRVCTAEAFPTSIRSTAFGLAMGVGRSGGVASSALGGALGSDRVQLAF